MHGRTLTARALTSLALLSARLDRLVLRLREIDRHLVEGLLLEVLDEEELDTVTIALFDLYNSGRKVELGGVHRQERGLFHWERPWYKKELPPPPGRILVGGAGYGREVLGLLAMGYAVDASEPGVAMAARVAEIKGVGLVSATSYRDLCDAVLDGAANDAAVFASQSYDAVLLGAGSLNHILTQEERLRIMDACDRLTAGPIMAGMFVASHGDWRDVMNPPRSHKAGRTLGRMLNRLRRSGRDLRIDYASLTWYMGFARTAPRADIEALAASVGRTPVVVDTEAYPYVTFKPRRPDD